MNTQIEQDYTIIDHVLRTQNDLPYTRDYDFVYQGILKLISMNPDSVTKSRKRELVMFRRICMVILRRIPLKLSLCHIGDLFNRDHATVKHSLKEHEFHIQIKDELYLEAVEEVVSGLKGLGLAIDDFLYR